jgi:hypothetical protein
MGSSSEFVLIGDLGVLENICVGHFSKRIINITQKK